MAGREAIVTGRALLEGRVSSHCRCAGLIRNTSSESARPWRYFRTDPRRAAAAGRDSDRRLRRCTRSEVRPFTDKQIELVTNFADQAVIAIENARLLEAEQQRTRELTESLEQQTATSDVLRVISSSPTDIQPVLETIGERAEKLCDAEISVVSIVDGELIRLASIHGMTRSWGGSGSARISDATHR